MNLPFMNFKKKKRKFTVTMQFDIEAKNVSEALNLADKIKLMLVSVKEKNDVKGAGPIA